MSNLLLFTLAVASVLATPGPTNALLTTSAALVGIRRSLPLVLGELAGYGISIAVLLTVSRPLIAALPQAALAIRTILVAYLLWLAWRLWRAGASFGGSERRVVTVERVFVTTLLNPKAAIFAFVVFPAFADATDALVHAAIFAATTPTAALAWMVFGAAIGRFADRARYFRLPRVTAVVMVGFACLVAGSAIAGWGG